MRKTDKKKDNAIRAALTDACETALTHHDGFAWLTHSADYKAFPDSLLVVCVYDTDDHLARGDLQGMRTLIKQKLAAIDIVINDDHRQIRFDTEERRKSLH
ncbi:MAG: Fis family transcriptional regulator [Chromatocurvus sp.]